LDDFYRNLVSEYQDPALVVKGFTELCNGVVQEPPSLLGDPLPTQGVEQSQLRMMYRDSATYLPDDILCKIDRAAMATSLETRVPYLDHRVAELAWQLPLDMKIRGNEGKWALRQVLYKYVPRELIDRPKAGFAIPLGQWLRGPLHDWAESLLAESRLQAEGYFHPLPIRTKWAEHLSGRRDHTSSLWAVLMFQAWLEQVR
jgi:asparagine synthase (glutamine-hydrolysing)